MQPSQLDTNFLGFFLQVLSLSVTPTKSFMNLLRHFLLFFCFSSFVLGESLDLWRTAFIKAARSEALAPNLVVRNLTILSIGSFECINSKEKIYRSYLDHNFSTPADYDEISALRGCNLALSTFLHPSRKSSFVKIAHIDSLKSGKIAHNPSFLYGQKIAQVLLAERIDDGSTTKITYIPKIDPGQWRRTPPFFRPPEQPHWPNVKFFCLASIKPFLPPPPPEPESMQYVNAVKEVKIWGAKQSPLRTKLQTKIAEFWKGFSYTSTPPGHWNEIAHSLARLKNLSILEESRLFALLNLSMADAGIVAWESKYHYHLWRPIHAIRHAGQFPATKHLIDPNWEPLLETPPHPEYISGHGAYSGAASLMMELFFETDQVEFSVSAPNLPGFTRSFDSFQKCAQEICDSRLFGGIHYSFSNKKALQVGRKIAQFIYSTTLKPL